jgi:hypothetical protein
VLVVVLESAPGRLLAEDMVKKPAINTVTMIDDFTIETILVVVVVEVREVKI